MDMELGIEAFDLSFANCEKRLRSLGCTVKTTFLPKTWCSMMSKTSCTAVEWLVVPWPSVKGVLYNSSFSCKRAAVPPPIVIAVSVTVALIVPSTLPSALYTVSPLENIVLASTPSTVIADVVLAA